MNRPSAACFVSPHGLGHASRAAAVLAALQQSNPDLAVHLYTTVDAAFFESSGCRNLARRREETDIGFVQRSGLQEDLPETIRRLDGFLPFDPGRVARLAAAVREDGCRFVLCDIAPLGIRVAAEAGIPSVLVESFTWDNLYDHYVGRYPELKRHADYLRLQFDSASCRIQSEPLCHKAKADLRTGPASRPAKTPADRIRSLLGIRPGQRMVLITMGGVSERSPLLSHLHERDDLFFVVAYGAEHLTRTGNIVYLPLRSDFYHPDLVNAADLIIGKAGYSTIAEVYRAGAPFGYVPRTQYPENAGLVRFLKACVPSEEISSVSFREGIDAAFIDRLLSLPRRTPSGENGAETIARYLLRFLPS